MFYHEMDKPRWVRAIDTRDIDALRASLSPGTVNDFDEVGLSLWSPLQYACQRGFDKEVKCLLAMGAKPNLKDDKGYTALHIAASQDIDCVRLLLRVGANVKAKTSNGYTPLCRAIDYHQKPIVRLLIFSGAKTKDCYETRKKDEIPKWVTEIEKEIEIEKQAAMILVGIRRFKRSPVLATNPLDITKLIAKEIRLLQKAQY